MCSLRLGRAAGAAVCAALTLTGCATAPGVQRLSQPSLDCMQAVVARKLPPRIPDKQAHCYAAGMIARYCSVTEAYVASVGKEVGDLFNGSGDFEWADLAADRLGIGCESHASSDEALERCCLAELQRRHLPTSPGEQEVTGAEASPQARH